MKSIALFSEQDRLRLAAMRKRLFVLAAYLLVSAALFIYVSYGQYRIRLESYTTLPQASLIQASLTLAENERDGTNVNFLADLAPGDSAAAFAESDDSDHKMTVTVSNCIFTTDADGNKSATDISEKALDFNVRIDDDNGLPLEFVLVDEEGNTYLSSYMIVGAKAKRMHIFRKTTTTESGTPTVESNESFFTLPADTATTRTFSIYVGWENTDEKNSDGTYEDNHNEQYRKEVNVLEIRAEIVSANENILVDADMPPTKTES